MSDYQGDIRLGDTIDIKFTTRQISGAPSTLGGVPVISAYPSNSVTELTAGITLSVDFDSRTGYNNVRVVATSGNGYATATNYDLCITTGTVNSVSVVGESIGSFSIENRSALMPTTAGRTAVVDAAGLVDANAVKLGPTGAGTAQTARDIGLGVNVNAIGAQTASASGGAVTFPLGPIASTTNITAASGVALSGAGVAAVATGVWGDTTAGDFTVALSIGKSVMNGVALGTGLTVNSLTNLPAIPGNWLTAAGIAANALNGKGDWLLSASYTVPPSAGTNAAAVWGTAMVELAAVPGPTAQIIDGLTFLFMGMRNKRETTATSDKVENNAGGVIGTAVLSDDGVTFTKGKFA